MIAPLMNEDKKKVSYIPKHLLIIIPFIIIISIITVIIDGIYQLANLFNFMNFSFPSQFQFLS